MAGARSGFGCKLSFYPGGLLPGFVGNEIVVIDKETGAWSEDILVSIYNISGGLVLQQIFQPKNTVELDLSSLKIGTYLLKLFSGEGVETKKIKIR